MPLIKIVERALVHGFHYLRSQDIKSRGPWETVQGPEGADRKKDACFAGEIGASGGGGEAGLVVEQYFALPIIRLDAEE